MAPIFNHYFETSFIDNNKAFNLKASEYNKTSQQQIWLWSLNTKNFTLDFPRFIYRLYFYTRGTYKNKFQSERFPIQRNSLEIRNVWLLRALLLFRKPWPGKNNIKKVWMTKPLNNLCVVNMVLVIKKVGVLILKIPNI